MRKHFNEKQRRRNEIVRAVEAIQAELPQRIADKKTRGIAAELTRLQDELAEVDSSPDTFECEVCKKKHPSDMAVVAPLMNVTINRGERNARFIDFSDDSRECLYTCQGCAVNIGLCKEEDL